MEQDYLIDDGLVERLHAALADALKRTRSEPFTTPVTVAEIYQDLVPYRVVRTVLGFQMNADYEHTLLRLLAGEAGLARLEPAEARTELTAELETSNPNVGLFRKFAACDVWIEPSDMTMEPAGGEQATPPIVAAPPIPRPTPPATPTRPAESVRQERQERDRAERPAERAPAEPTVRAEPEPAKEAVPPDSGADDLPQLEIEQDDASAGEDAAWQDELVVWAEPGAAGEWDGAEGELLLEEEVQTQDAGPDITSMDPAAAGNDETRQQREAAVMFDSNQSQSSVATMAGGNCVYCQSTLPGGRIVKFCQNCGADQSTKPCSSCREPLDPGWKFCIGCGRQQS